MILLDKILNIHNMIERISLKHNHYEKNTNEEVKSILSISAHYFKLDEPNQKINLPRKNCR